MSDETKPQVIDDVDAFLEELTSSDPTVVHEIVYEDEGETYKFLVKEFDQDEILEIVTGPLFFVDGKYVKKARHEAEMGVNLRIHFGIVRNVGTDERPRYERMFTLAQLRKLYQGRRRGRLLNFLLESVNRFNPDVDITKKK